MNSTVKYMLIDQLQQLVADVMIVWCSEQEQSWDVASRSPTISTKHLEKVTIIFET